MIGWDWKAGKAMKFGELFGIPQAYTFCTEEQTKRTLHMLIQVWIEELKMLHRRAFFGDATLSSTIEAKDELCRYIDGIASTALDNCFHSTKRAYAACFLCGNDFCK